MTYRLNADVAAERAASNHYAQHVGRSEAAGEILRIVEHMTQEELLRILDRRLTVAQQVRQSATQRNDQTGYMSADGRVRELEDVIAIVKANTST